MSKKKPSVESCPKCMKALYELKGKKGSSLLVKYVIASTMWEKALIEGKKPLADWLRYEICRFLHGWTLDDQIRYEREEFLNWE